MFDDIKKSKAAGSCAPWNITLGKSDFGAIVSPVHIEMKSNRKITVEGCRGIEEYDENVIRINVSKMLISFFGRDMQIRCLTSDALVITGFVTGIEFES